MTVRTIKAGAVDFLIKPVSSDRLLEAVAGAIARREVSRDRKVTLDIIHSRIATLTPRERQVFELVIRGKHNKQIANALGCTERTSKAHRHGSWRKCRSDPCRNLSPLPNGLMSCAAHKIVDSRSNNSQQFSSCYWPTGQ